MELGSKKKNKDINLGNLRQALEPLALRVHN